jgi:hypothetical protein
MPGVSECKRQHEERADHKPNNPGNDVVPALRLLHSVSLRSAARIGSGWGTFDKLARTKKVAPAAGEAPGHGHRKEKFLCQC